MTTRISAIKPSAQRLFSLLGQGDYIRDDVMLSTELYDIGTCAAQMRNRLYEPTSEYSYVKSKPLPLALDIAEAFRLCMRDYPDTYVSEEFSRFLLSCGHSDLEVIHNLSPWDRMMFDWRDQGMTPERLQALLEEAGLPGAHVSGTKRAAIEGWIARPESAIQEEGLVLDALLGPSDISVSLMDEDGGTAAQLFAYFFQGLDIAAELSDCEELSEIGGWPDRSTEFREMRAGENDTWRPLYDTYASDVGAVRFTFHGVLYVFFVAICASRANSMDSMCNFDAMMQHIGRPERVLRIVVHERWWEDGGSFIVGDPVKIKRLMDALGIRVLQTGQPEQNLLDFGLGHEPYAFGDVQPTLHTWPSK